MSWASPHISLILRNPWPSANTAKCVDETNPTKRHKLDNRVESLEISTTSYSSHFVSIESIDRVGEIPSGGDGEGLVGRTMRKILSLATQRVRLARRGRAASLLTGAGAILLACGILFDLAEWRTNDQVTSVWSGLIWVLRTLLEQSSPWDVTSRTGNFLYFVVLLVGVSLAAMATGVIASKLIGVVMRRKEGWGMLGS
jgi:hypothetical protein